MELRHLRFFVTLAQELHFTRAAERLHVAQPHLSQEIRRLERELGVTLFDRTRKRVTLTPAGTAFLEDAQELLWRLNTATDRARRVAHGETGKLTVGFAGSAGYDIFPTAVRTFRERHPDIALELVELSTVDQLDALRAGRIDVGVGRPIDTADPQLAFQTLRTEPFVLALATSAPLTEPVLLADLADAPWISFQRTGGAGLHVQFLQACAAAGFEPRIVQHGGHVPTMLSLVAAGLGLALVPEPIAAQPVPGVRFARLAEPVPSSALCLAWRAHAASATVAHFRACFTNSHAPASA